jgi:hypothetical protein
MGGNWPRFKPRISRTRAWSVVTAPVRSTYIFLLNKITLCNDVQTGFWCCHGYPSTVLKFCKIPKTFSYRHVIPINLCTSLKCFPVFNKHVCSLYNVLWEWCSLITFKFADIITWQKETGKHCSYKLICSSLKGFWLEQLTARVWGVSQSNLSQVLSC